MAALHSLCAATIGEMLCRLRRLCSCVVCERFARVVRPLLATFFSQHHCALVMAPLLCCFWLGAALLCCASWHSIVPDPTLHVHDLRMHRSMPPMPVPLVGGASFLDMFEVYSSTALIASSTGHMYITDIQGPMTDGDFFQVGVFVACGHVLGLCLCMWVWVGGGWTVHSLLCVHVVVVSGCGIVRVVMFSPVGTVCVHQQVETMGMPVQSVCVAPSGQAIAASDAAGVVHVMANCDPFNTARFAVEEVPEPPTFTKRLGKLLGDNVCAPTVHGSLV